MLWIPVFPLIGFFLNLLLGKRISKLGTCLIANLAVFLSFIWSLVWFFKIHDYPEQRITLLFFDWITVGQFRMPVEFVLDPLSGTMLLIITGIGSLIHIYSAGYMWEDKGIARYFSYLNLFIFFMTLLVLASNLPLLFVGWEGVGLCSYLLIGFYFNEETASAAGLKAFLYNRIGDVGVLIGMMILFTFFQTLNFAELLQKINGYPVQTSWGLLTLATMMLFIGCMGKSAQVPLFLWLPDAMAGPTPVSALIHAATMVTSGIYLVCRLAPLFSITPITLSFIAWIGVTTALVAASIGVFQRDIKKILAYSTVSQLGFMFLALGVGGFSAGFFHVFTHAWFKALLFLGAGSVIHALHHQQDIFLMGGLRKKLPITFVCMAIGTLCLIGFPGTSGFASKDEILYVAYLSDPLLWGLAVLAAMMTSFYMVRLMTLTFGGTSRDSHAFELAHEGPYSLTTPLVVLALGALLAVKLGWPAAFGGDNLMAHWIEPSLHYGQSLVPADDHGSHSLALKLAAISTALGLLSASGAYLMYRRGNTIEVNFAIKWNNIYRWISDKYYLDSYIDRFLILPFMGIGKALWKGMDVILIDGLGVNFPGALVRVAGDLGSSIQTGRVRNYTLLSVLGLLGMMLYFVWGS